MWVKTEDAGSGVVVVKLNDPKRRNAMTRDMGMALRDTFDGLSERAGLRSVVLTGAPPAFSAGGDLGMLEDLGQRTREEGFDATQTMLEFYDLFLSIRRVPVPVVGAINGHAVGAGACIALATDLRVIASDCKFGLNFAKLGLHPGMGGTWLLPQAVGPQRAAELLYTGRLASGSEMHAYGAALASLPAEEVLPRALDLAKDVAASSPVVCRQMKRTLQGERGLSEQLQLEAECQAVNYGTEDLQEGLSAIRQRRMPKFADPGGA